MKKRQILDMEINNINVSFPNNAYEFFIPGEHINIIDLLILQYINHLSVFSTSTQDNDNGVLNWCVQNNKAYFEISYSEFVNLYPIISNLIDENLFMQKIDLLNLSDHLLSSIEVEGIALYRTTSLYDEIFLGL